MRTILIIIFFIYSTECICGQKALIVMDLQYMFALRADFIGHPENNNIEKKLVEKQIEAIELAKSQNLPIIHVEYFDSGETLAKIENSLKNYKNIYKVYKSTDGLFDSKNRFLQELNQYLKEKNIDTLIFSGANGGACVYESMKGALSNNFNVIAYTESIADFNYPQIKYPFKNYYNKHPELGLNIPCEKCSFKEIESVEHLTMLIAGEKKGETDLHIDNSSRMLQKVNIGADQKVINSNAIGK